MKNKDQISISKHLNNTTALTKTIQLVLQWGRKKTFDENSIDTNGKPDHVKEAMLRLKKKWFDKKFEKKYDRIVVSSRLSLPVEFWDKKSKQCSHPFENYNIKLDEMVKAIKLLYQSIVQNNPEKSITPEYLREQVNRFIFSPGIGDVTTVPKREKIHFTKPTIFRDWIEWKIARIKVLPKTLHKTNRSNATLKNYEKFKNRWIIYEDEKHNEKQFDWLTLSDDIFQDFIIYLVNECRVKHSGEKYSSDYIGWFKSTIRLFIREAKHEDKIPVIADPNMKYLMRFDKDNDDVYFTAQQLEKLYRMEFDQDDFRDKRLEDVRDLCLLMCSVGMNYADIPAVKIEVQDTGKYIFEYQRGKNGNWAFGDIEENYFPKLWKKHNNKFPVMSEQNFNEKIKIVCLRAGFNYSVVQKKIDTILGKEIEYKEKFYNLISSRNCRKTMATLSLRTYKRGLFITKEKGGWKTENSMLHYLCLPAREEKELMQQQVDQFSKLRKVS